MSPRDVGTAHRGQFVTASIGEADVMGTGRRDFDVDQVARPALDVASTDGEKRHGKFCQLKSAVKKFFHRDGKTEVGVIETDTKKTCHKHKFRHGHCEKCSVEEHPEQFTHEHSYEGYTSEASKGSNDAPQIPPLRPMSKFIDTTGFKALLSTEPIKSTSQQTKTPVSELLPRRPRKTQLYLFPTPPSNRSTSATPTHYDIYKDLGDVVRTDSHHDYPISASVAPPLNVTERKQPPKELETAPRLAPLRSLSALKDTFKHFDSAIAISLNNDSTTDTAKSGASTHIIHLSNPSTAASTPTSASYPSTAPSTHSAHSTPLSSNFPAEVEEADVTSQDGTFQADAFQADSFQDDTCQDEEDENDTIPICPSLLSALDRDDVQVYEEKASARVVAFTRVRAKIHLLCRRVSVGGR